MFALENFLKQYLKDEKLIINLLENNLKEINTELLIKIIKLLNNELIVRIGDFENGKI